MIPAFDPHGLLPPGEHRCTLLEAEARFAINDHRRQLWRHLDQCLLHLKTQGLLNAGSLVIDGSYVTDKMVPEDIEVSLDTRTQSDTIQGLALLFWLREGPRWCHQGVSYHPTLSNALDFTLFFQYLGPKSASIKQLDSKHPKGILRIFQW